MFKRIIKSKRFYPSIIQLTFILIVLLTFSFNKSVALEYKAEIEAPEFWQATYPGHIVTFNLEFQNPSPYYDSLFLYIDNPPLPENWTASFYVDGKKVKGIDVKPQQTVSLVLKVRIPENATPGDYRFRVQIDGDYVKATKALTVTVESITRKISLSSPFKSQSILTGRSISYPIMITNEGSRNETIFLEVSRSLEMMTWEVSFSENQLKLAPKQERWVMLHVKSPVMVKEGNYSMKVIASTQDGKIKAEIQITTRILGSYLLEIVDVQPISLQVYSGEKIDVIVTVKNIGQSPLTNIKLNVSSPSFSNILVTPLNVLSLEPFEKANFHIRISTSSGLTPGNYVIKVQAKSNEAESSIRSIIVSVMSPIPWFWINTCLTIIATAAAIIAIQKIFSKFQIGLRATK